MAPPPPPPPPAGVDEGYSAGDRLDAYALAPVGTLVGIACITTGLRVYWRLQPSQRIGADDYTLLFALLVTLAWYGVDAAMYHHGRGVQGFHPDPWTMGPLIVADGVLWVWGMNLIRISVALMLLRFRDSRSLPWTMTVWAVVAVQACMLAVGTVMHLIMCRPISARWAPTPSADCIPLHRFRMYGYVYSGFTIASDLVLSLLPIVFIRTLSRPWHEKVLIGLLMAAGMAATGVAVARLLLIMGYLGRDGPMISVKQDILWGLELSIGVLAASIPSLKAPVHRILRSCGLLPSRSTTSDLSFQSVFDRPANASRASRRMGQWKHAVGDLDSRPKSGSREDMFKSSDAS
ncbi:hypothetical protein VTH06DRAFT_3175 [Thermothelomyces fergusii]